MDGLDDARATCDKREQRGVISLSEADYHTFTNSLIEKIMLMFCSFSFILLMAAKNTHSISITCRRKKRKTARRPPNRTPFEQSCNGPPSQANYSAATIHGR